MVDLQFYLNPVPILYRAVVPLHVLLAGVLTPIAFRSWLARQDPDAVVGLANRAGRCPLARYLRYALRDDRVYVSVIDRRWVICVGTDAVPLPTWAVRFAERIDIQHPGRRRAPCRIMAASALAVLDDLCLHRPVVVLSEREVA